MLQTWQAVVLGLIEGITEYLPVSSTGHLIIGASAMGLHDDPQRSSAVKTFEIAIQAGAIAAVAGLYFPRFVQMLKGLLGADPRGASLAAKVLLAFIPAAAVGLLIHDAVDAYLMNVPAVIVAFIVGGVFMIIVDRTVVAPRRFAGPSGGGKEIDDLSPGDALKIGLLQCVALWPGTSRSMMTITGGAICGLRPAAAAEFSFLLGMPTLLAATGYALFKNFRHAAKSGTPNMFEQLGYAPVLVGALVAAASAAAAVYWLVKFLNRHGLAPFGYYRLVAGCVLFLLMLAGVARAPVHTDKPVPTGPTVRGDAPAVVTSARGARG